MSEWPPRGMQWVRWRLAIVWDRIMCLIDPPRSDDDG